jgi:hypothetical protein
MGVRNGETGQRGGHGNEARRENVNVRVNGARTKRATGALVIEAERRKRGRAREKAAGRREIAGALGIGAGRRKIVGVRAIGVRRRKTARAHEIGVGRRKRIARVHVIEVKTGKTERVRVIVARRKRFAKAPGNEVGIKRIVGIAVMTTRKAGTVIRIDGAIGAAAQGTHGNRRGTAARDIPPEREMSKR